AEINRQDQIELFPAGQSPAFSRQNVGTGVVDPDIHPSEAVAQPGGEPSDVLLPPYVGLELFHPPARSSDLGGGLLCALSVAPESDRQVGTRLGASHGDGAADPAGCTSDQYGLALQRHAASPS